MTKTNRVRIEGYCFLCGKKLAHFGETLHMINLQRIKTPFPRYDSKMSFQGIFKYDWTIIRAKLKDFQIALGCLTFPLFVPTFDVKSFTNFDFEAREDNFRN